MRRVSPLSGPPTLPTIAAKVNELCSASQEVTEEIADGFTLVLPTPFIPVHTLDVTEALTVEMLGMVLATFLHDMKQRGANRKQGNV